MTDTTDLTCDWCGNPGHTPDAHPLPADHPHHDPDLDDNPLMDLALADLIDWQNGLADVKVRPAPPTSPLGRMLGAGPDARCNEVVHWWPTATVKAGDPCICGQHRKGQP